jgi:hypothetical protein
MEQLNFYIAQLPCWHYSPSTKPSTILMNMPFTKADLVSHVLWMCPHTWQDQFNRHKKGMSPVNTQLLLLSLEAIEHVCTQERSNAQSNKKANPNIVISNNDDVCPMSVSNADDITVTSSSQNIGLHVYCSTPTRKDPLEGKHTAAIAVMRGKLKDGCHCHHNNKH